MIMMAAWVPSLRLPASPSEASGSQRSPPPKFSTQSDQILSSSLIFGRGGKSRPATLLGRGERLFWGWIQIPARIGKLKSYLGLSFSQEPDMTFAWKSE